MTRRSVSILIPIHNEREIVRAEVRQALVDLNATGLDYELLLVENGSTDGTLEILQEMAAQNHHIVVESLPVADYGIALRHGILKSAKDIIVIFNLELRDLEFVRICLDDLPFYDLIIASKTMKGATDERPFLRRLTTRSFNAFLKWVWGFRGTDTHGIKGFWREHIVSIASQTVTNGFIFDSELVIRSQRMGLRIKEVPAHVKELRPRSGLFLLKRVPGVLKNLWKLFWALRQE